LQPANPSLKDVIERHREKVMSSKGVVGIAAGLSKADPQKRCIQVYVITNDWPAGVPRQLDGYDVELVKTRAFRAT
jgi:hypothetical protein